ncbi:InlB B-repeat-containing protein [Lysinibacillus pakistanensis]|uniref:InlB B-repeat-containing protein n=1 Tax=Lysinibacillus pakistanensis TaxID=759811 RepID=UPI003D275519
MSKVWKRAVSLFAICLLFTQTIFGSVSVLAESNGSTQPILNIIMTTDGEPYKEGDIATSPVTIQVTTSSADSASIQIELSKDKGDSWEELDSMAPLVLTEEGDYYLWFRIKGQQTINKHHVRILPQLTVLAGSHPIYVNAASTGGNNGSSWNNAFKDLQSALNAAQSGDEIWIATGTYTPTKKISANDPRTATFQMKNGVAIYGGFQGTETKLTERNVQANPTILNGLGDIYHVFYHPNGLFLDRSAVLDGVTITGGNANGNLEHGRGGGMYNSGSSPTITNVTFSENRAGNGGGVYSEYVSNQIITNVLFSGNKAENGGGMHHFFSNPTITNVVFSRNEASFMGGGMYNFQGGNLSLTNVTFSGNKADHGGGLYNDNSSPTITSVTFSENKTKFHGGGMYNWASSPTITNVTFNSNEVGANGGGMYNKVTSSPTLTNIKFNRNEANDCGGGMYSEDSSPTLMNVEFSGNTASYGGGIYNINNSSTLTNVTISGNQSMVTKGAIYGGNSQSKIQNSIIVGNHNEPALSNYTGMIAHSILDVEENGAVLAKFHKSKSNIETNTYKPEAIFINPSQSDYRLRANSPAINKGNNSDNTMLTDLADNPRIQGETIDLGAYEAFPFTVTYQGNGATGGNVPVDKETYNQGHPVIVQSNSGNLERAGYTFKGWNTQADGKGTPYTENVTFSMGKENVTLYAEWTKNPTYTVTYDANGATGGQVPQDHNEYEENEMVTVQSNSGKLTRAGYTFKGWNTQADGKGTPYTENVTFSMGKENVTLYAEWIKNPTYTVTYDANGATGGQVPQDHNEYEENEMVTVQSNSGKLMRAGYTFKGWNTQADGKGTLYAENTTFPMGKGNVTLYAEWTKNPTYTVTYDANGAADGQVPEDHNEYEENEMVTVQSNSGKLVRAGYTFKGWNTQADGKGTLYAENTTFLMGKGNVTLYAEWTKNPTYTVTYDANGATGGQVPEDHNEYEENEMVTVQSNSGKLVRSGYTFKGWNTQADGKGTVYAENTTFPMGKGNVTLYAEWTKNPTYTVTYDANGAADGQVPQDHNEYEENEMVTVQSNSGKLMRAGYTFKGWNTQADGKGTLYAENTTFPMGKGNVTLYAEWTKNPTYTVTYDANGATGGQVPEDPNEYEENEMVTVQSNSGKLVRAGYTFKGWNTQADGKGTLYAENTTFLMGKGNVTLYAEWTVNPTYHIQYDANGATGGQVPEDHNEYEENEMVTVQSNSGKLVRAGYTFKGWNTQADGKGTPYTENAIFPMGKTNITLYAQWTVNPPTTGGSTTSPSASNDNDFSPPAPVKITFHTNGGTTLAPIEIAYNTKAKDLPIPTREGFRFDGWYQDVALTTQWAEDTLVRENLTLYAKWTVLLVEESKKPIEPHQPSVVTFQDIENHWAREMIEALATLGIIKGYKDDTFRPDEPISRQHVMALFSRAFEFETIRPATVFSDVAPNHIYYEEIMIMQRAGIIDGTNGTFAPASYLTRAQLAKVLVGTLRLTPEGSSSFKDVSSLHWSAGYIATLERRGIALGDNGYFRPEAPVTRSQLAAFLYRAMQQGTSEF